MKILIFGCSKKVSSIQTIISEMKDFKVIGYVDNDPLKWGTIYYGKIVLSLDEMIEMYKQDNTCILIANRDFNTTYSQVVELVGVKRVYLNFENFLLCNKSYLGDVGRKLLKTKKYGFKLEPKKDYLLICNRGLPAPENLYRKAFVLQRLIAYQNAGVLVDAYGLVEGALSRKYEFSEVTILEGDIVELENVLRQGHYKKILVHFLDYPIYMCLKRVYGETIPEMIVWCHGFEILKWDRRKFNYTELDLAENSELYEKSWEDKKKFWQKVFDEDKINCVFVSEWLKRVTFYDVDKHPFNWTIIPNYINENLFQYHKKEANVRLKILLIKSHQTRMYANDIAEKVIMELSKRPIFEKLFFSLYGEGILFDENFKVLLEKKFENVQINKKYLQQKEIAELHKEYGIFLCPTRQDTQGVSMCEAMSSGMVVVTNKVAAVPEYIDNTCGCLCSNEDYMEMADAIEYLYYHPEAFLERSNNAALRMRQQCGWFQTIQKEIECII